MRRLKAVLVDDEFRSIEFLQSLLDKYCPQVNIVATAGNVASGYEAIQNHSPDVVFLDVEMPDGNGFSLLEKFSDISFQVIFVTSHSHYALSAIKFSALDYLLKPVDSADLIRAVEKLESRIDNDHLQLTIEALTQNLKINNREQKKIVLRTAEQIYVVDIKEIVRLEADMKYTTFFMEDGRKILVSRTLKDFDDMLDGFGFLRVHQSHLIHMRFFDRYEKRDGGSAVMKDKSRVPVAVRKKEDLLNFLDNM